MLGPVFQIEMLGLGRRRRYLVARLVYGLILFVVMGLCYAETFRFSTEGTQRMQAAFANAFFIAFSCLQLFAVVALTPTMIAGTIAGEHERRTIDYLLTTSLNDSEITLGKFAARLLAIGGQLAVGLPILAIAMTLGGIEPEKLFESFLIALVSLASIGGMALAVSARSKTSREALTRCYVILFGCGLAPPLAWALSENLHDLAGPGTWVGDAANWMSSVLAMLTELDPFVFLVKRLSEMPMRHVEIGTFTAVHLVVAVLFTVSSTLGLRRFYVRQSGKGAPKGKTSTRTAVLGDDPMWWKERIAGKRIAKLGWMGRVAAVLLYGLGVVMLIWTFVESLDGPNHADMLPIEIFGFTGGPMIATLAMILIVARTAGSITSEREQDTWATLLSTPLEGREIVWAKFRAALYSVRYWYFLVFLLWGMCGLLRPLFLLTIPILIFVYGVMAGFCAATGIRCSLSGKTSLRAMGTAFAVTVIGAGFGPVFLAIIFHSGTLVVLSPPVTLGFAQAMAHTAVGNGHLSGADEPIVAAVFAVLAYAGIGTLMYQHSVHSFDSMNDRIAGRPTASTANSPGD